MKHIIVDSQEALDGLLEEVAKASAPLYEALDEAKALLESAMHQACYEITATDQYAEGFIGWLDTAAISTWNAVGDWLVEHAGWEHHPSGVGRRQFYRPPAEQECSVCAESVLESDLIDGMCEDCYEEWEVDG